MPTLTSYKGLQVLTPDPTGAGGLAIQNDFKQIVDWQPKSVWAQSADPTAGDDEGDDFFPGSCWLRTDTTPPKLFVCRSSAVGAAVWQPVLLKVAQDASPALGGALDAGTFKVTNLGNPTSAQDGATKSYVDMSGLGQLFGLQLSNNATDAANDIDIAAGTAWASNVDAGLRLTSTLTKRLDASWSVGTNQGGLDTGSKANSTWYHVWLIRRSDTGVVDALFSTNATSPTMPTNYDQRRRIGSIVTNGSGAIRAFTQIGDYFDMADVNLLNGTAPPTTGTPLTVISPAGIRCQAIVFATIISSNGTKRLRVTGAGTSEMQEFASNPASPWDGKALPYWTNTSSQIFYSADSSADCIVFIGSRGWIDRRGQDG